MKFTPTATSREPRGESCTSLSLFRGRRRATRALEPAAPRWREVKASAVHGGPGSKAAATRHANTQRSMPPVRTRRALTRTALVSLK
mmetsp:Transcript_8568/g.24422  ORF Transcript_8568/g.24422 Transcript_8568/m.24422 type:complete len:87 (+) Transcript_8568:786-1046(+)